MIDISIKACLSLVKVFLALRIRKPDLEPYAKAWDLAKK